MRLCSSLVKVRCRMGVCLVRGIDFSTAFEKVTLRIFLATPKRMRSKMSETTLEMIWLIMVSKWSECK